MSLDVDGLRHAMHEQERAEGDADDDGSGEVVEDGEEKGRQQHDAVAGRALEEAHEGAPSAMFHDTTTSTAARAASGTRAIAAQRGA